MEKQIEEAHAKVEDLKDGFADLQNTLEMNIRLQLREQRLQIEKLEKDNKIIKLKLELKKLKGGEKMTIYPEEKTEKPIDVGYPTISPKDLNRDGKVTPLESNIYDFFTGVFNTQQRFFQGVIENTQKHSLWTILGSMAFLLAVVIFSIFIK